MPQNDKGQNKHRGSKNTLKNATASIDFEFLEMDSASKKLILEMGGEIRVPRSGRSITKNEGNSLKRLYHELDNHTRYDMSILHMKDYGLTDELPASIMDKLISKIGKAYTIQVLYIQNFPDGMLDAQLAHLTEVLKKGHIWAMNIGEAAKVSLQGWQKFAADLKYTNITHMYASENTLLTKGLKIKMMDAIRENRKTDKRHYDKSNRHIIDQVKKMWFNPSRSPKYQRQFKPPQGQEWSLSSPGAENNITNSNGKMNNNKACSIQEKKKCALIPGGSSKKKSASSSSSKKKKQSIIKITNIRGSLRILKRCVITMIIYMIKYVQDGNHMDLNIVYYKVIIKRKKIMIVNCGVSVHLFHWKVWFVKNLCYSI